MNAPIVLELLQKTIIEIPHFREIEIATISLQIVAIIATVVSQYYIRTKEQEEIKFIRGRVNDEIQKGRMPHKLKPEEREKLKRRIATERLKMQEWQSLKPIRWYRNKRANKMNDLELRGHQQRDLEAYVLRISPLNELEEKLAKITCQLCNKKGHSAQNCKTNKKRDHSSSPDNPAMEETSFSSNSAPPPYTEKQRYDKSDHGFQRCRGMNWKGKKTKQHQQRLYPNIDEEFNDAFESEW